MYRFVKPCFFTNEPWKIFQNQTIYDVYFRLFSIDSFIFLPQLLKTGDDVAKMQEELETMKPLLEEAAVETASTMEQIEKDTVSKKA